MTVSEKVSCAMHVSVAGYVCVVWKYLDWNKQLNTLACREGGNDVGEHWHTQRVLANYFFA